MGHINQKEVCMIDSRDKDRGMRKKYAKTDIMGHINQKEA